MSCPQHTASFVPRGPPARPGAAPQPRWGFASRSPLSHCREGLPALPHTAAELQGEGSFIAEKRPSPEQCPGTATAGTTWMANTLRLPLAPQRRSARRAHNEFLSGKNTVIIPHTALTFKIPAVACPLSRVSAQNSYLRLQRVKEVLNLFWQHLFCQVANLCQFIQ